MELKQMTNKTNKTFKLIHMGYIVLGIFMIIYLIFENSVNWWRILLFISVFTTIIVLRHTALRNNRFWMKISPYLELAAVVPISFITQSAVSLWLILIINIDIIIDYDTKFSTVFSFISYVIYIVCYLIKLNPPNFIQGLMVFIIGAAQYTLIMSVGFIAKRFYLHNNKYKELVAKQKVQMLELEQLAVVKERNRMAGEIHDTVGHQLTTALVQLEATTIIIDKDIEQAKRRLHIIRDQIKTSLHELRSSIRELKEESFEDFPALLIDFAKKVKSSTGIDVITKFTNTDNIPSGARKAIYRMSMESITNAIKHGRCNRIWWDIIMEDEHVNISIENDGLIPDNVVFGFGLNRMKERIEELGGSLAYDKGKHGFRVKADINFNQGDE